MRPLADLAILDIVAFVTLMKDWLCYWDLNFLETELQLQDHTLHRAAVF